MRLCKTMDGHTIRVLVPWDENDRKKMESIVKNYKIEYWWADDEDMWDDIKMCFSQSMADDFTHAPNTLTDNSPIPCVGFLLPTKEILKEIIQ